MTLQRALQDFDGGYRAAASSSLMTGPWQEQVDVVDEAQIAMLQGKTAAGPQDVAGTAFTYRHDWGNRHGSWKLTLNFGASVGPRTRAFVAIGEGAPGGPDGGKFLGSAKYTLFNVAPRNGGVDIWVNIDWGSDIRIYVDYLIINP